MNKRYKYAFYTLLTCGVIAAILGYLFHVNIAVLEPKGGIGVQQRDLFVISTFLMLIIVIPVFIITAFFALKYHEKNRKAKYTPDWDQNHILEAIWWGFPCVIVLVLSILTWKSCHELDPFKPIDSATKPLRIQAVALDWKWLFIYPDYNIATVNFIQMPLHTPVSFDVTSDAPMNSLWIPQLGGQIYAMAGMRSKLHLIADHEGSYDGCSANLSGEGFAGMRFIAKASSEEEFTQWVSSVKNSPQRLDLTEYNQLLKPSSYNPAAFYILEKNDLFDYVVKKYLE